MCPRATYMYIVHYIPVDSKKGGRQSKMVANLKFHATPRSMADVGANLIGMNGLKSTSKQLKTKNIMCNSYRMTVMR